MEQFTYIYKQGALCGTARAARTIGPRPSAGYGYPEKPPVSPAGGGPARGRAIQPAPLRRITPPAPAGTNACSVPVKYWKRRCRLCCVLFGHSGRSTPQAANSGAGGRTHRAPRPGIGPLHGEETENSRRSGGNGSNGAPKAAEASSASETV